MQITILDKEQVNGNWRDAFSSEFGVASAEWVGKEPTVGENAAVELEFQGEVRIAEIDEPNFSLLANADDVNPVLITAMLESITEDGVGILRMGKDLLLCDLNEKQLRPGYWVEVAASKLLLYPVNY